MKIPLLLALTRNATVIHDVPAPRYEVVGAKWHEQDEGRSH